MHVLHDYNLRIDFNFCTIRNRKGHGRLEQQLQLKHESDSGALMNDNCYHLQLARNPHLLFSLEKTAVVRRVRSLQRRFKTPAQPGNTEAGLPKINFTHC